MPTASTTRRFACVLNVRSASSRRASCAAILSAGTRNAARGPPNQPRTRSTTRSLPCQSALHTGTAAINAAASPGGMRTSLRRTIARSNVFSAATWRAPM
jgi:hypothetical protein